MPSLHGPTPTGEHPVMLPPRPEAPHERSASPQTRDRTNMARTNQPRPQPETRPRTAVAWQAAAGAVETGRAGADPLADDAEAAV